MPDVYRCARGRACAATETAIDETGAPVTVGATVTTTSLCEACTRQVRWAINALPLDVAELTTLLAPSLEVRYRDPDMPAGPHFKKHPPLPINGEAEALRALIDHEVTVWADHTADAADHPWSADAARRSRIGARVQTGCQLLSAALPHLLGLGEHTYPARSTGVNRGDGHDLDEVTVTAGDLWARRDGVSAALHLLALHEHVERFVGRAPADRLPVPCPTCQCQALHRQHARIVVSGTIRLGQPSTVVCRMCWSTMSDDAYARIEDLTALVFGVSTR